MNLDQGPLAEAFVEDTAQSSARCVAHRLVVAAQVPRQFVERALDGAAQGGSRRLRGSRFDYPDRADRRFFFQAEDGIRDIGVTGVQTCALPIYRSLFLGKRPSWSLAGAISTKPGARIKPMQPLFHKVSAQNLRTRLEEIRSAIAIETRSEERRVGKECRSRSRPTHSRRRRGRKG